MMKLTLYLAIFLTLALVLVADQLEEQARELEGDVQRLQLRGVKNRKKIKKTGQRRNKRKKSRPFSRIVGGTEAKQDEFPWHATIKSEDIMSIERYLNPHYCGAVVIDESHVLTAAHCVVDMSTLPCYSAPTKNRLQEVFTNTSTPDAHHHFNINSYKKCRWLDPMEIRIHAGIANINSRTNKEQRRFVDKIFVPEEYYGWAQNDIAVMLIHPPFNFQSESVASASLPEPDFKLNPGSHLTVTGFGRRHPDHLQNSDHLLKAEVDVFPTEQCYETYPGTFKKFCAGKVRGGVDSCQGDSGGPIGIDRGDKNYTVVGIVSYGIGCAWAGFPGVYTEVRYFLDFIEKVRNGKIVPVAKAPSNTFMYAG